MLDCISWAKRSQLVLLKKLAVALMRRIDKGPGGMLDNRSNAYVEAVNELPQKAKRPIRGFITASNFIAIAYFRMSKLNHLPSSHLTSSFTSRRLVTHRCL